ncbi:hypothetical protein JB92DRAFT_2830342 [Gautieria morchelliformis]|nr:hypothetical protein JB92DRAFT_2830342 [Gautieria morchelliformis]
MDGSLALLRLLVAVLRNGEAYGEDQWAARPKLTPEEKVPRLGFHSFHSSPPHPAHLDLRLPGAHRGLLQARRVRFQVGQDRACGACGAGMGRGFFDEEGGDRSR